MPENLMDNLDDLVNKMSVQDNLDWDSGSMKGRVKGETLLLVNKSGTYICNSDGSHIDKVSSKNNVVGWSGDGSELLFYTSPVSKILKTKPENKIPERLTAREFQDKGFFVFDSVHLLNLLSSTSIDVSIPFHVGFHLSGVDNKLLVNFCGDGSDTSIAYNDTPLYLFDLDSGESVFVDKNTRLSRLPSSVVDYVSKTLFVKNNYFFNVKTEQKIPNLFFDSADSIVKTIDGKLFRYNHHAISEIGSDGIVSRSFDSYDFGYYVFQLMATGDPDVLIVRGSKGVVAIDVSSKKPIQKFSSYLNSNISFSPDGKRFTLYGDDNVLKIASIYGGKPKKILDGEYTVHWQPRGDF